MIFPPNAATWPAHPDAFPEEAAIAQALPEVQLRMVEDADYEILARGMLIENTYMALGFDEEPNQHHIRLAVLGRQLELLMIVQNEKPMGVIPLYFRGLVAHQTREFDIAIPEPSARKAGLAKAAIRALETWAFDENNYSGLWAKIFADNNASLSLVRSCHWPSSEIQKNGMNFMGVMRDLVYVWMTPALRAELKHRRGF